MFQEPLLIIILIFLAAILGLQLYNFWKSKASKKDSEDGKVTLESLDKSLDILMENSRKVSDGIQEYKTPMNLLSRYLSGGARAGVVGEWGLEAIISEILPSDQYEKDFQIIPDQSNRVEFAIKMPEGLFMPVDSKFHSGLIDRFEKYIEISETGEEGKTQLNNLRKEILDSIKVDAQDINQKYMQEGITVDVGVMFIMSENLVQLIDSPDFRKRNKNIGIREEIFNDYRVLIMGPNTFAAYLTSVYMGFKNLSLNESAKKVVKDLGKAKKEFNKFSKSTQQLIKQAESLLNKAREQETRERAMNRALDNIDAGENKEDDDDEDKQD
tara:strand:+ start:1024 stop:2004 length:981 start_codon:yes stop_codon:yes gene_type:complete